MSETDEFVVYPRHNLVTVFDDIDTLKKAVSELRSEGFSPDEVRSFIGKEGMEVLDLDGSNTGSMAELLRSFQRIGPDRTYIERYEKHMSDGNSVLMIYAPDELRKQSAANILRKHSSERITYFGTLVIEEL